MTASILTIAYLASRDNSAIIGENVASAATARWAADSGVDLGLALLETEADWRTLNNGVLADDFALGDGTFDITVVDLETGAPPTSRTEYIELTSRAMVNGVEQVSKISAYVPSPAQRGVDVDLSEFAVFGADSIQLSGDATVTRWPRSPLSVLGQPIAIGTQSTSAGSITLSNNGAIVDGKAFVSPTASSAAISTSNGRAPEVFELPARVPMPAPPATGEKDPADLTAVEKLLHLTMDIVGGLGIINTSTRVADGRLSGGAVRTLRGPITYTSNDDLEMSNAKILVEGTVKMVIFDDLIMQNASIELRPGARLLLFVGDAVSMQDSYIGDQRSNALRDNTGMATPMNPERIKMFRVPQYTSAANWVMSSNSVMKGSVYARNTRYEIKDQSALYGRVAAQEVRMSEQAAVFYEPALNRKSGYTDLESPMYNEDGTLKDEFRTIPSLSVSDLQAVANTTDVVIKPATDEVTIVKPAGYSDPAPDMGAPTQPTPRTVKVVAELKSYGSDIQDWENHGG
jgi:hypothetical protein